MRTYRIEETESGFRIQTLVNKVTTNGILFWKKTTDSETWEYCNVIGGPCVLIWHAPNEEAILSIPIPICKTEEEARFLIRYFKGQSKHLKYHYDI
jgi:hypothetical protein